MFLRLLVVDSVVLLRNILINMSGNGIVLKGCGFLEVNLVVVMIDMVLNKVESMGIVEILFRIFGMSWIFVSVEIMIIR